MYDSLDFDALEAAGIANPRERAGLLTYLDELGFTVEEMVQAERRGRLFGLAGDVLLWSGPPIYTLATAATIWGCSGRTSHARCEFARPHRRGSRRSHAEPGRRRRPGDLGRTEGAGGVVWRIRPAAVLGTAMARLAEAESTMIRAGSPNIQMTHTHDELATARAYRAAAEFVPRIGALIDTVHRHHLASARTYFEGVIGDTSASVTCGIGFADLSSFTALTQALTPAQLQDLLTEFDAAVTDVVHADGGRLVKFIGDAVMWVSSSPERLVRAAVDLVDHPGARAAELQVRAGLAYGTVLALNGDYFGNPVNLAARLVAAAAPGQILAAAQLRDMLPDWPALAHGPLTLKGFDAPVMAFELHDNPRARDADTPSPAASD
ncbi:hypothetical protein J113_15340 [Mycobacterium tuberculosis CAS/NITR204]|uniref:Guanylate cyclase domain-containing protein n=1 Tax=Mycobacterium tuberculosis CAS/NITR204 TaxID=1310114 RepID=R4MIA5_MYCTX|nr:hypothetical protein J113_15340 [Mycobacterium tuberculosis CAS/NITR204]